MGEGELREIATRLHTARMRVPPLESDPSMPLTDLDGLPVDLGSLRGRHLSGPTSSAANRH